MNGQFPQPENQMNRPKKPIFIMVVVLVLGYILGFITNTLTDIQINVPFLPKKPTIEESKLPVSSSVLTNPIVYEWRGSVKGKLTKKDEHTFTLVDNKGNSITITDTNVKGERGNIRFLDKVDDKALADTKVTTLSNIPIGSVLLGDFFIFKNGPNIPVGSMFTRQ